MRQRRALGAFIAVLLHSLTAAIVAATVALAINSGGGKEAPISALVSGMVITLVFATYVYSLGVALLYRNRIMPSRKVG